MVFVFNRIIKLVPGKLFTCPVLFFCTFTAFGQQTQRVNPQFARGNFINDVRIVLVQDSLQTKATQQELEDFYNAFFIKPGTTFNPLITDLAISRIIKEDIVKNAYYELYEAETGSGTVSRPLSIFIYVEMLPEDETSVPKKGILTSNKMSDFPLLYESPQSQLKFLVNGGVGLYNDENALFGQGAAFTEGNPIADNPAGEGNRFWGETFVEPGISTISKLGRSNVYWYGEYLLWYRHAIPTTSIRRAVLPILLLNACTGDFWRQVWATKKILPSTPITAVISFN